MRRLVLGLSALVLICSAGLASAAPWVPVKTAELTVNGQSSEVTHTVAYATDWRYRWHNGQWWYYTPSNSWVVWSNGRWSPWTGGYYSGYRARPYYRDGYYGGSYYRDGYRYGYRDPYYYGGPSYYGGRTPYVSGYRGGVNVYGPRMGWRYDRRW